MARTSICSKSIWEGDSLGPNYKELRVWQEALALVTDVYKSTSPFPKEEMYGLTSQMRRSAVSVPSNIAEGKGRYSNAELRQFLILARGSLLELETQIQISENLGFLQVGQSEYLKNKSAGIGKMLNGLIESVKSKNFKSV